MLWTLASGYLTVFAVAFVLPITLIVVKYPEAIGAASYALPAAAFGLGPLPAALGLAVPFGSRLRVPLAAGCVVAGLAWLPFEVFGPLPRLGLVACGLVGLLDAWATSRRR